MFSLHTAWFCMNFIPQSEFNQMENEIFFFHLHVIVQKEKFGKKYCKKCFFDTFYKVFVLTLMVFGKRREGSHAMLPRKKKGKTSKVHKFPQYSVEIALNFILKLLCGASHRLPSFMWP